jgi:chromosome segregation ATPase
LPRKAALRRIIDPAGLQELRPHAVDRMTTPASQTCDAGAARTFSNRLRDRSAIMMQAKEIEQRFTTVERSVEQLKQAVNAQKNVPQDLKDCVQQLGQQTSAARQVVQSQDEQRIVQAVDELEQFCGPAKDVA